MNTLSKEKVLTLVKEFRQTFHNKDLRPKFIKTSYGGYKQEGVLQFQHYILYALIRDVDPLKACKNKTDILKVEGWFNLSAANFKNVFPSLTEDEFRILAAKYLEASTPRTLVNSLTSEG